MLKKLRVAKVVIFCVKIWFLIWILSARYGHTGRVCSGEYEDYDHLKQKSNFDKLASYTFDRFSGFVLKFYVWVFLIRLFLNSAIAFWLGTDFNPNAAQDNDDDFQRYSPKKRND